MTSRTPMGVQQRPPQRTLSNSSLSTPRPSTQQRNLSQQHIPSSPVRREPGDQVSDSSDAPPGRHGIGTPRRGASRLRLELSNEAVSHLQIAVESPQSMTSARPLTLGGDGTVDGANSPALSRVSHQENNTNNPPLPMPKRPKYQTSQKPARPKESPSPTVGGKKDGRPKPYTVEIPPDAPRLAPTKRNEPTNGDLFGKALFSGYGDFFPWSGNHFEDEWSTESITKGTWEKPSSTESSPARLAILPALKQKNGLSALSTIYMGVLNQRRQRGQITAPSTFKPPPRVTLTDTKREVWLKDLANPATSLRRLSRTIPHGVRGRVLLDQCLNKRVPTERAVWLAKCVGANEIRAFKRKGVNGAVVMGGEAKWSRDWTGFVEQFIDSVTSAVHDVDWKSKVTYAIRLASNLYWEQLLDREHYLEWMTAGLESSTTGKLPMWILIVRIYWADLLRSRKHGKRLVYGFLLHLKSLYDDPDRDVFTQLSNQLSSILRTLIQSHPESFVCPADWSKYRETLKIVLPVEDQGAQKAYSGVNARNAFLAITGSAYPPAGKQQLVRLLDSTFRRFVEPDLATKCWEMSDDKFIITRTLVEWATSAYRPGLSKIYVAASLLRSWASMARFEATPSVLEVLDGVDTHDADRKNQFYLLVSELVRNGSFSIPYYLQWLIARGGFHGASDVDPDDGPCATRLLIEMPIHCFPKKWRNERSNLLRRAGGYSTESEEIDLSNAIKCVDHTLGLPLPPDDPLFERKPLPLRKLLTRIRKSSRACKASIGCHLRDVVARQVSVDGSQPTMLALFMSARAILETAEDFAMLSDTIRACSKASEPSILAACADTVNAHLSVFIGMGSAVEIFQQLCERLRIIIQQGVLARPLLASISYLANRLPDQDELAGQLAQQLLQCDRSSAIDACSPVSDNMITQSQGAEGEISEEIDKLLASGNSIDHPTMNRLFRTLVPRLEAGWSKLDESRRVFASLLTKMRVFDPLHFDKLMTDWVSHVSTMDSRPKLLDLYPLLLTAGCLNITVLLHSSNISPAMVSQGVKATGRVPQPYFQELLELLLAKIPKSGTLTPEEEYQFTVQQQSAQYDDSSMFLSLVRSAIVEYISMRDISEKDNLPLEDLKLRGMLIEGLRYLVTVDSAAVSESLSINNLPDGCGEFLSTLSTRLLLPDGGEEVHTTFDQILGLANELTLPFCQLKLNLDLSMNQGNTTETEESVDTSEAPMSRFELFATAMDRAIEANNIVWTSMLPCLSTDIAHHLRNLAYSRFLGLVPSLKSVSSLEGASEYRIHMAENLIGVIEAISAGQPSPKTSQLSTLAVEKLVDLGEIIASREHRELLMAVLNHWLPALLRLIILQGLAHDNATLGAPSSVAPGGKLSLITVNCEARARAFLALCNLLLILQCLPPEVSGALSQQVFDVAIVLVDALPDDLRQQCARNVLLLSGMMAGSNVSSDPRLYYLLSTPQPAMADNLVLAHKDKPGTLHGSGGRGMGAMYGIGPSTSHKLSPFMMRRWEMLNESTPNVGENDTSLSLGLFEAIKIQ
ncbi:unnamed protein product [Clonostachys rosea]|uniref:Mediator of RNA polymerase II transcription subunit 12 n=1 Tax=Bionectria ochroleuca TaxID=29856 RepID=A0ABY6UPS4_BIOOC|nr:unnamed protein product [Clonostachys rosea]